MATHSSSHDSQVVSVDNDSHQNNDAPPYRCPQYEIEHEERRVSPEPEQLPCQRDWSEQKDHPETRPSKRREFEARSDNFDHHHGRSNAATRFDPSDVDDREKQRMFERLKGWNDGTRDSDRQSIEGEADKVIWTESYGHCLELPRHVVSEAKLLLDDLEDIRQLGIYNSLHTAILAALTEAYRRHWLRRQYRCNPHDGQETWREREDFRRLWTGIDLTENQLYSAVKLLDGKTEI